MEAREGAPAGGCARARARAGGGHRKGRTVSFSKGSFSPRASAAACCIARVTNSPRTAYCASFTSGFSVLWVKGQGAAEKQRRRGRQRRSISERERLPEEHRTAAKSACRSGSQTLRREGVPAAHPSSHKCARPGHIRSVTAGRARSGRPTRLMLRALVLSSLLCLAMSVKVDILSAHPGNAKVTTAHAYDSRECAPSPPPRRRRRRQSSRATSRGDLETLLGDQREFAGVSNHLRGTLPGFLAAPLFRRGEEGRFPHSAKPHTLPSTQR